MRIRLSFSALCVPVLASACATSRRVPPCYPGYTQSHSAIAWGPAHEERDTPRGRVFDAGTGQPLEGAVVILDDERRTRETDRLGEFPLPYLDPGVHRIRVRKVGYADVQGSIEPGRGGLRILVALAPSLGLVNIVCTGPAR